MERSRQGLKNGGLRTPKINEFLKEFNDFGSYRGGSDQTLKQELPPGFQRAEFLLEKGMVDMIVDRADARETLARLIDYSTGPRMGEGQSVLTARNRPPLTGG